ncbi:hypothetical protein N7486_001272 [Penicillium sp. IBT 16267x]|nr:hypothetical protein N7486_001272 [Penicillium sp. IBT 16267x]
MADLLSGLPIPFHKHARNHTSFSIEDFQPIVAVGSLLNDHKRTRNGERYAVTEDTTVSPTGRYENSSTRSNIIHRQSAFVVSIKIELQEEEEDRYNQNVLQYQDEKVHEEVRTL